MLHSSLEAEDLLQVLYLRNNPFTPYQLYYKEISNKTKPLPLCMGFLCESVAPLGWIDGYRIYIENNGLRSIDLKSSNKHALEKAGDDFTVLFGIEFNFEGDEFLLNLVCHADEVLSPVL